MGYAQGDATVIAWTASTPASSPPFAPLPDTPVGADERQKQKAIEW
jgi:hypothetical protein